MSVSCGKNRKRKRIRSDVYSADRHERKKIKRQRQREIRDEGREGRNKGREG
jgi:hypothetical protein